MAQALLRHGLLLQRLLCGSSSLGNYAGLCFCLLNLKFFLRCLARLLLRSQTVNEVHHLCQCIGVLNTQQISNQSYELSPGRLTPRVRNLHQQELELRICHRLGSKLPSVLQSVGSLLAFVRDAFLPKLFPYVLVKFFDLLNYRLLFVSWALLSLRDKSMQCFMSVCMLITCI